MRRKVLIVVLGLLVLSQLPFAYRRYRLRRLQTVIRQLTVQRSAPSAEDQYVDYKGVIHVHSFLGGHSTGTFTELIAAAKANQLDFVMMTEHPQAEFSTAAMTLDGPISGVLFVRGNEVATSNGDRILELGGVDTASPPGSQTTETVVNIHRGSSLSFVAYPTDSQSWKSAQVDGVEVYNLFTNGRQINPAILFFDGLWSYRSYADLMFANFFVRPDANLAQWDQAMAEGNRKLVAIAGNDAHSNVGLSLNDESGKQLIGTKLDPYERSFRTVRTHVLIKKGTRLTRESLLEALSQGHCYVSFDLFSDASGFSFSIKGTDAIMGDETTMNSQSSLSVLTPLAARVVLLKNGHAMDQKLGRNLEFRPDGAGVYRVEVYLDSLPSPVHGQPWIISNPIYLR
jgi:hypothetical protein